MATLTLQQAAAYARAAGFQGDALVDIVSVVPGESGGSTTVVNSIGAVGVWQINQPVHVKDHPGWTVAWLQDPANNATAAKVIFDQQGMDAWEVWTNGTAAKSLPDARAAVAAIGGGSAAGTSPGATQAGWSDILGGIGGAAGSAIGGIPGAVGGAVSGTQDAATFMANMTKTTLAMAAWVGNPDNWLRIAQVVVGGALVLVGLGAVAAPGFTKVANSAPVKTVTKLAKTAAA